MNLALRTKKLQDGRESLFLDLYNPKAKKKRTKKFLGLYIFTEPQTPRERNHNKKTLELAETIKSKHLVELQYNQHGLGNLLESKSYRNFIDYFEELADRRYNEKGNYGNWKSTLLHLIEYGGENVPINEINVAWLEGFKDYLLKKARKKTGAPLSRNSCYSYFNKVKASLRQAVREQLIAYNPGQDVEGIKQEETEREFLTLEELKAAFKAECDIPIVKTAFLFSCLTGLRWSDIHKLTWGEVRRSEQLGWYLRFRQKKTSGFENHPISQQAIDLLPERGSKDNKVFRGLSYSEWHNVKLAQWLLRAGITKTITFHCARHTYATLQLTLGTDIYTVSKLLGHKELKTTQIYAKIIDQKKIEAANVFPDLNM